MSASGGMGTKEYRDFIKDITLNKYGAASILSMDRRVEEKVAKSIWKGKDEDTN
jgi:hypothetical protein